MGRSNQINLLEGSVYHILIRLAAPLMATAFAQVAYSLVDVFWIGHLGVQAVAATGAMGYFLWIAEAVVQVPRVGMGILSSQYQGSQQIEKSHRSIASGAQLAVLLGLLYGLILLCFQQPLIHIFQLEDRVNTYALSYLQVIAIGMPFIFLNPTLASAYHSMGDSKTPFQNIVLGLFLNMILDPIFIMFFGLGVRGAAIATVTAQVLVSFIFFGRMYKQKHDLSQIKWLSLGHYGLSHRILKIGLPSGVQNGIHAVISIALTSLVAVFGSASIAVFSTGSQIESITWLSAQGVATGLTAVVGQHVGARLQERLKDVIKKGMMLTFLIGVVGMLFLLLGRHTIFTWFIQDSSEALRLGTIYLIILGLSQPFMGLEIGTSGIFYGFKETRLPSIVGITLNVLRIPLGLWLMQSYQAPGIWWAISISSMLKGIALPLLLWHFTSGWFATYHQPRI
ncbi:MATE family efflux transporter [Atopobacter phocae]|uniref:MATE family efflux transporter n=1 Tax=Atopobacter phocae TaxID=136492 RepID=UPI00046FDDD8|nr:MATE family efflux transporter [Atopobacter phocae]